MIDLHNHILPTIDDGARDMDEALAMAKMAADNGVRILAATPHRFMRGQEISRDAIIAQLNALQDELDSRAIPLRLVLGSEVPLNPDVVPGLREDRILKLGGSGGTHVLIEPPFDRVPAYALPVLEQIVELDIGIVLAHPERNSEVQRDPTVLESCAELGIVMQITSGSLLGRFGPQALNTAKTIVLNSSWKVIIASDSHWAHDRTPEQLRLAFATASDWLDDPERAKWMVFEGPASCLPPECRLGG